MSGGDCAVSEPPIGSWARTDGEQWYHLPAGWIEVAFADGAVGELKDWRHVTADGTYPVTISHGREPTPITPGCVPAEEPQIGSWATSGGELWCRGPQGVWSQVSDRGASVGDTKTWKELWAVPTREHVIKFVEELRDATGQCLADDLGDLAHAMRDGKDPGRCVLVADAIEAHDRAVIITELERLAAEFHQRSNPDDRYSGLEEAAWGWAAERLQERIAELEERP